MDEWSRRGAPNDRIEIELTPVAPRASRAPPQSATPAMAPTDRPDQVVHHGTPRSLLLTGAAVSIGSLAIGWMMGGGASENEPSALPAATASTTAVATSNTDETQPGRITATNSSPETTAPSDTAPSEDAPSEISSSQTAPAGRSEVIRRSSASTVSWAAIPSGTPIELTLPADLRGLPYEVAAVDGNGAAYRIDLMTATVRRYPGPIGRPSALAFANDGQLLRYNRWDSRGRTLVALDGTTTMLPLPGSRQVGIDGIGTLWSVDFEGSPFGDARRFDQYGSSIGESFPIPTSGGILFDPGGGLIVIDASGAYELSDDGAASRLAAGDIIALGASTAIVRECDGDLSCSSFIVERATGVRRPISLDEIVAAGPPPVDAIGATTSAILPPYGWLSQGAGATITGNVALLPLQEVSETGSYLKDSFALIDIEEHRMIGRAETGYPGPAMTADGSWVFSIDPTSGIIATNTTTGRAHAIDLDHRDGFYALAVRST